MKMPANHVSNAAYEKVSMRDEFDEDDFLKKTPIDEIGSHVSWS